MDASNQVLRSLKPSRVIAAKQLSRARENRDSSERRLLHGKDRNRSLLATVSRPGSCTGRICNKQMTFLEKLHYTILKEIHFQAWIIRECDVPEPDAHQIIRIINARSELAKLQKHEQRIRIRFSELNTKKSKRL